MKTLISFNLPIKTLLIISYEHNNAMHYIIFF